MDHGEMRRDKRETPHIYYYIENAALSTSDMVIKSFSWENPLWWIKRLKRPHLRFWLKSVLPTLATSVHFFFQVWYGFITKKGFFHNRALSNGLMCLATIYVSFEWLFDNFFSFMIYKGNLFYDIVVHYSRRLFCFWNLKVGNSPICLKNKNSVEAQFILRFWFLQYIKIFRGWSTI